MSTTRSDQQDGPTDAQKFFDRKIGVDSANDLEQIITESRKVVESGERLGDYILSHDRGLEEPDKDRETDKDWETIVEESQDILAYAIHRERKDSNIRAFDAAQTLKESVTEENDITETLEYLKQRAIEDAMDEYREKKGERNQEASATLRDVALRDDRSGPITKLRFYHLATEAVDNGRVGDAKRIIENAYEAGFGDYVANKVHEDAEDDVESVRRLAELDREITREYDLE